MAISLQTFRQVTTGFTRACHFNLGILDFKNLGLPNQESDELGKKLLLNMSMFVSSTALPTKTIEQQKLLVQYGQPGLHIANNVSYQPWTVTFHTDGVAVFRNLFLSWQEAILSTYTHSYTTPSRYKSQKAFVALLNGTNNVIQTYSFRGLFPTEVGAITLNQQDSGVATFDVTFQYDYFEINTAMGVGMAVAVEKGFNPAGEEQAKSKDTYDETFSRQTPT
jgi:hypothetical protein